MNRVLFGRIVSNCLLMYIYIYACTHKCISMGRVENIYIYNQYILELSWMYNVSSKSVHVH